MSNYAPQPTKEYEYDAPFESQPQTEKKKSGCFKGCLIIGIVGVIGLVLCCGGFFIYAMNSYSDEPAKVNQMAKDMLDCPLTSEVDDQAFGLSIFMLDAAMKGSNDGELVMLVQSFFAPDEKTVNDMQSRLYDAWGKNEDIFGAEDVTIVEAGEETIEIAGNEVTLTFNEVEGDKSGDRFWEVSGAVPKGEGIVAVYYRLRTDKHERQDVVEQLKLSR